MAKKSFIETRWFALSGRELGVLAVAAALALAATATVSLLRSELWRQESTVKRAADVAPAPARINVNTAPEYELRLLPGIGPKTARSIIEYRRSHGEFSALDDLQEVKGIGPATVRGIRPHAMCLPGHEDGSRG